MHRPSTSIPPQASRLFTTALVAAIFAGAACVEGGCASTTHLSSVGATTPAIALDRTGEVGLGSSMTWSMLPDAGLGPRDLSVAVWTGHEVLLWGGRDDRPVAAGGSNRPTPATATPGVAPSTGTALPGPRVEYVDPSYRWDGAAYDPVARTWRPIPAVPLEPGFVARAVATGGSRLTVMFTHDSCGSSTQPSSRSEGSPGAWFDPTAAAWHLLPKVPHRVPCNPIGAWLDHQLLVAGLEPGADADVYDEVTETWRHVQVPALINRVVSAGQRVLAFGSATPATPSSGSAPAGTSTASEVDSARSVALAWDGTGLSFELLPSPPAPAAAVVTATGVGDKVYVETIVAGGGDSWLVDPVARTWTHLAPPPLSPRETAAVVGLDDRVVVWGGGTYIRPAVCDDMCGGVGPPLGDGAVLDIASGSWTMLLPSPLGARMGPAAARDRNGIFVWGGRAPQAGGPWSTDARFDGAELN